jgi:LPS sulfotransferase NodH
VPPSYWGERTLEVLAVTASRATKSRAALPADRFLDLDYDDLVADPIGVVARVYDACGRPFTADIEAAIDERVAARPQHQHGVHRYSVEQFGLSEQQIRERFAAID